jgi:hypothetical protein
MLFRRPVCAGHGTAEGVTLAAVSRVCELSVRSWQRTTNCSVSGEGEVPDRRWDVSASGVGGASSTTGEEGVHGPN